MFARDLDIPGGLVPSPLATRPGGEACGARSRSAAQRCLCNAAEGSSPAEREEAPVFSQHIVPSPSSMPLLPVPALLGAGRHFGNSLLLAPFFSPSLLLPAFAVAIKSIILIAFNLSPTFQSCPHPQCFPFTHPSAASPACPKQCHFLGSCLMGKPRHMQLPGTGH